MLSWIAFGVALLLTAGIAAVLHAPATWLDQWLREASRNGVRLADARGSLWEGEARLVLRVAQRAGADAPKGAAEPANSANDRVKIGAKAEGISTQGGVVVPGVLQWRLRPLALLVGAPAVELRIDGLDRPLLLTWRNQTLIVPGGKLLLPRMEFSGLGAPWNTLGPSAAFDVSWSEMLIAPQPGSGAASSGELRLKLRDVAANISPVQPLGSYEWHLQLGPPVRWQLSTLEGSLNLQAQSGPDRSIRIEARPQAQVEPRLRPLLSLMGSREGDVTVMRIIP
ncbi:MAG: type II secretion system protein N [Betaproteobacteria bacterium]